MTLILHIKEGEHMGKTFYYARVSSADQHLDRQLEAFRKAGAKEEDIFADKASGKDFEREQYRNLRDFTLREGDTLVVKSLDRLSRNKDGIKDELSWFKKHGIRLEVLDIPTTCIHVEDGQEWIMDMVSNILIEVYASIAEQERLTIRKRQAEGIAEAKKRGAYKGGKKKELNEPFFEFLYDKYARKEISKAEMARELHVSRPTMDRILERKGLREVKANAK